MRGSEQQFLGWGQGVPSSRLAMCCLCRSSLLNGAFRNAVFTLAHGCLCSRVVLSHLASSRVVSSRCVSCCLLSSPLVSSRVLSSLLFSPHFHLRIHHSCFDGQVQRSTPCLSPLFPAAEQKRSKENVMPQCGHFGIDTSCLWTDVVAKRRWTGSSPKYSQPLTRTP